MKKIILGIRNSPIEIRYAVIEKDVEEFKFLNRNDQHKIIFPKSKEDEIEKMKWYFKELESINNKYKFDSVVIKINEYTSPDSKSKRISSYFDAISCLFFSNRNINVHMKTYSSLKKVKSSNVQVFAEEKAGKTDKYWNKQIADAIAAACLI